MLDKHPDAGLRVIAVWYDMIRSDDRSRWQPDLLRGPRVTHFWDTDKVVGRWYGEHVTAREEDDVEWDMFFIYDRQVVWSEGHPEIRASGRPIVEEGEKLSREVAALLDRSAPQ